MTIKRQSLAQLFRDLHKIEAQVALLRLDLQAAGILPKTKITVDLDDSRLSDDAGTAP